MDMLNSYRLLPGIIIGSAALSVTPALHANGPAASGLVGQADTAESVFVAPAAMSRLEGTNITVQGVFASSFSSFDVDEGKTTVGGGDPDKGSNPILIPSLYYVRQLNDKWNVGASFTVPSGFGSDYGSDWAGRYQTVDFSLVYVALTPAVSYRVNDKLSLGASVGINYTSESSEVKFPQPLGETDGKLTSDLDAMAFNVSLSMFYEFTDHTRAGISWTSDTDSDLEGNVRLRKLGPVFDEVATDLGIKNINTKVTNTLPQRVVAGIYHELDSGNYLTLDSMWMKFSDFSTTNIKLNGNNVNVSAPSIYNDLWAVTIGAGFPVDDRTTYKVGAMYLSEAVDDDKRTFSIRMDAVWGMGVGVSYDLTEQRRFDLNASFFNVGDAPVDTGGEFGRVAGENDDPYAVVVDLAYHF